MFSVQLYVFYICEVDKINIFVNFGFTTGASGFSLNILMGQWLIKKFLISFVS
jgi:hypothetical protein